MLVEVECDWCGKKVERYSSDLEQTEHTFCSETCSHKWQSENWRTEKRDKIRLLRKKGYSFKEIGGKLGISPATAYKHSSDIDIQVKQTEEFPKRRELYQEGMVDREIAEREGVSQEAICNWRNSRDLPPNGIGGIEVECDDCGKKFEKIKSRINKGEHHFCSMSCYGKWRSKNFSKKKEVECDCCGKSIEVERYKIKKYNHHFCSEDCFVKWKNENSNKVKCDYCGELYKEVPSRVNLYEHTFCSGTCRDKWQSENLVGKSNPVWRGGKEPYYGASWIRQRRRALERDNRTCQLCGAEEDGKEHSVHHFVPFREFGLENHKEANSLENLITLCQSCHMLVEWRGIELEV